MALYASKAEIQKQAIEPESLESVAWESIVGGASRLIDQLANVPADFFAPAGAFPSNRIFYGDGTAFLRLDPYAAAAAPTVTMETGYDEPTWIRQGEEGLQFLVVNEELKRQGIGEYDAWKDRFTGWPDRVAVTVNARWGFSAIPADVKQATIEFALALFRRADAAKLQIDNTDSGYLRQEIPPTAAALIKSLRAKYGRHSAFV